MAAPQQKSAKSARSMRSAKSAKSGQSTRSAKSARSPHYKVAHIFSVPVTNIAPESIGAVIDELMEEEKSAQIVFLSWWGFVRAVCQWNYRAVVRNATLVIPTSSLLAFGARVLYRIKLPYYTDFYFVVRVLSRVGARNKSVYLLGMKMESVQIIEQNIKNTFPNLMVVGRYAGYFTDAQGQIITTAIRKTNAALLFAGHGVPGKETWLYRVKHKINPCIMLWSGIAMNILAGKAQKPPDRGVRRLTHAVWQFMRRPWRVYRFFVFLFYFFALWYRRIFKR